MHTIYYTHIIKEFYKSKQFYPSTSLYTYIEFNTSPKIFSSCVYTFSGERIKKKFYNTYSFVLLHKIIHSRSRLIISLYESNCCLKTEE